MAQKEEILKKVNQLCEEHKFDFNETFKDKFAETFAGKFAETDIEDETLGTAIELSIIESGHARKNAFSESSKQWEAKEAALKAQLKELEDKTGDKTSSEKKEEKTSIPEEFKAKLDAFEKWKQEQEEETHRSKIYEEAKKNVREDLHDSLKKYMKKQSISLTASVEDEAKRIVTDYQDVFKDTIGGTQPLASGGRAMKPEDYFKDLPKVKITKGSNI